MIRKIVAGKPSSSASKNQSIRVNLKPDQDIDKPNGIELFSAHDGIEVNARRNNAIVPIYEVTGVGWRFEDIFQVIAMDNGKFKNPELIEWHFQFNDYPVDAYFGLLLVNPIKSGATIFIQADYGPTVIYGPEEEGIMSLWYTYKDYTSEKVTIEFASIGKLSVEDNAVGVVDEGTGSIDFTVRDRGMLYDSATGLWVSDEAYDLVISTAKAFGRDVIWHHAFTIDGNTEPDYIDVDVPGLFMSKYGYSTDYGSSAMLVALQPAAVCQLPGLPDLGTLVIWCEIDGNESESCTISYVDAGSLDCCSEYLGGLCP